MLSEPAGLTPPLMIVIGAVPDAPGLGVGVGVGDAVGEAVGEAVGWVDGEPDGCAEGVAVGVAEGDAVGPGDPLGAGVGCAKAPGLGFETAATLGKEPKETYRQPLQNTANRLVMAARIQTPRLPPLGLVKWTPSSCQKKRNLNVNNCESAPGGPRPPA